MKFKISEAKLSWSIYVHDNTNKETNTLEQQTVINMFDFIDEVAEELQLIIDLKQLLIEKYKNKYGEIR